MPSTPDVDSLRCLVAAASARNFRQAARQVALSPSAFSDRIKRLEETVGAALFARSTRHVDLTPAGERLARHAAQVLAQIERSAEIASGRAGISPFELTLGTRYELGLSWIVPNLAKLERERPERSLHLYFGDSDDLMARVLDGRLDAVVTSARLAQARLQQAPLHREDYVFVAARKVLARARLEVPEDAAAHTLLELHPDLPLLRYFLDARPASEAWRFAKIHFLGTIGAVRARLLEGNGVAVLPRYFVEGDLRRGRLMAALPKTKLISDYFRLVWRTGHPREDELHALAAELAEMPLR